MEGIDYLKDKKGKKTAVVISLRRYKAEITEFLNGLEAASRVNEPSVDYKKAFKKILKAKTSRGVSHKNKKVG